ncbi:MAG: Flp pilus assembly complex ATPase component TadA [Magnetococcales bacterium]|nr:Flp pilus assembly complex ATPase component TadA [Magnetococcales bacterium]
MASQVSGDRPPIRVGDFLLDKGMITQDQLEIALAEQKRTGNPLGELLVHLGFVPESVMRDLLGEVLSQDSIDLKNVTVDPEAISRLPREFANRYLVFPTRWDPQNNTLTVAMANTLDMAVLDKLQARVGADITIHTLLASESEVTRAIDQSYGFELSLDGILREIETGEVDQVSLPTAGSGEFSHPMVRLVNALLADAVKRSASDIHISPLDGFIRIRYRIDGVLRQVRSLHSRFFAGLVVRVKVMAGMNIAESRAPQDGRLSLTTGGQIVDFRVSVQPTTFGENLVLRVLDRSKGVLTLDYLGLSDPMRRSLSRMMARPEGIILVTGPTGSGKTTTLYAMMSSLDAEAINIMTLEDPVEYPLRSILQSEVNEAVNLTFATGVRAMLRQDPDIILVGEIRDEETSEMALRAAMTGHQVYSTLHANSALGAFARLLDVGARPDMLAGNVIGIVAQRLVRRLCPKCKQPYEPNERERAILGIKEGEPTAIYKRTGCPACDDIGYKGRLAVMEAVIVDDDFDDLISKGAVKGEFRRLAKKKGVTTLLDDGLRWVSDGATSLEEIGRVLDLSAHLE